MQKHKLSEVLQGQENILGQTHTWDRRIPLIDLLPLCDGPGADPKVSRTLLEMIDDIYDINPNEYIFNPNRNNSSYRFNNKFDYILKGVECYLPVYLFCLLSGRENVYNYYVDIGAEIQEGKILYNSSQTPSERLADITSKILDETEVIVIMAAFDYPGIYDWQREHGGYSIHMLYKFIDVITLDVVQVFMELNHNDATKTSLRRVLPAIKEAGPECINYAFVKLYTLYQSMNYSTPEEAADLTEYLLALDSEKFSKYANFTNIPVCAHLMNPDMEVERVVMLAEKILNAAPNALERTDANGFNLLQLVVAFYRELKAPIRRIPQVRDNFYKFLRYLSEKGADFSHESKHNGDVFQMCFTDSGKLTPEMKKLHRYLKLLHKDQKRNSYPEPCPNDQMEIAW